MRVRPAAPGDRDFVLGLSPRFAEFELPPWRSHDDVVEGTRRRLAEAFDATTDRSTFVIAENEDGERLGFAWLMLVDDFYTGRDAAKISEIAVLRDGTGAGSALMRAADEYARGHGCRLAVLNVMEGNARARAFYRRHGFDAEYTLMAKRVDGAEKS
ncbi:MAG TPA: GNAT family N-acetyltransferase [Candidatus Acidoferrales bacterium]|nr:GNAT family N-acetyltransferase [Candidatus Acidoferrales bacterium]